MKRYQFAGFGLDQLQCDEVTSPEPGTHELLVEVQAVSLNFRDVLVIAGLYVLGFAAFHFSVPMLTGALVLTAVVAIAVSVPSAPGFIGAYQLGCVLGLAIFAIPESEALAYSIVLHITQFVAVIGAGLYSLWTEGISMREVEAVEQDGGATA